MADDRCERYAEAINNALPHEPLDSDIRRAADAAMAVADSEHSEKLNGLTAQAIHIVAAVESLTEENTRIYAELVETRRRAVNDIFSKNDDIARLREELAATVENLDHADENTARADEECERLRAELDALRKAVTDRRKHIALGHVNDNIQRRH